MNEEMKDPGSFPVEISGWGLDDSFFVEKTDLVWLPSGEKQVLLHHALQAGAIIFVRLQSAKAASSPIPIPYQVSAVRPMDCRGQCELSLTQLHPRLKESNAGRVASKLQEDKDIYESLDSATQMELEEVLR